MHHYFIKYGKLLQAVKAFVRWHVPTNSKQKQNRWKNFYF